ncbi:MAG: urease accessory protein UreF [Candidatus Nitrosoglobus sp.]
MIAAPRATESTSINGISHPQLSAFLTSLQLTDSFFPSGLYTLSHGLEAFAQAGLIKAENLELLLIDHLRHNVGPADGAALACAHRAVTTRHLEMAAEADLRLSAVKLPKEARTGSQRVGRQLLKTAVQVFRNELVGEYLERARSYLLPCNHAVVLGLITASHDIERHQAITGELYAFVSGALSAAVRLAVIDHLFAQAVLHRLKPVIAEVALSQSESSVQDIASSSPLIDIMAMQHERAQLRLFVS